MRSTPSSRSSVRGFTLPELLVAASISMGLAALVLSGTLTSKRYFGWDLKRMQLDQNLRSAMDVISTELRVGGENLPRIFPAFEIVDGGPDGSDELIIRRNLLDEVLPVCTSVVSGGSDGPRVYFARAGATTAACNVAGQTFNYNAWRTHRLSKGGVVKAFVYDVLTRKGEFFDYIGEGSDANGLFITPGDGGWQNSYPETSSSLYILEEWMFRIAGDLLQLRIDGEQSSVHTVSSSISRFQVAALMADGTNKLSLGRTDDWTQVRAIEVAISASTTFEGRPIERLLNSRYFPRNILSQ